MRAIASSFGAALVLLAAAHIRAAVQPVYFSLQTLKQIGDNTRWRGSLVRLELAADLTPSQLQDTLERAVAEARSPTDKLVYSMLQELFAEHGADVPKLLSIIKLIYSQMRAPELANFEPYLRSIGPSVDKYVPSAETTLSQYLDSRPSATESMGKFFRAALNLADDAHDEDVLDQLSRLDLASSKYNAVNALAVAKSEYRRFRLHSRDTFAHFLEFKCTELSREPIASNMDVLNLALGLETGYEMPTRMRLVNQYRRICLEWSHLEPAAAIIANFERQHTIASRVRGMLGAGAGGAGR